MAKYQQPSRWRSVWQIVDTHVPYAVLWVLMYRSLAVSYWITLPLAILAGGFLMRVFIIHHDCGHGSFFKSQKANDICGFITGVLVSTPYHLWRWEHAVHHASAGDLDRRGLGAVWTLTVQEIPGSVSLEALRLSPGAQPVCALRAGAAYLVRGPVTRCIGRTWRVWRWLPR